MPTGMTLDDKEFNRAMDEYLAVSSRDRATVANTKMTDWMIKSFKAAPKASREEVKKVIESPKLVSWWLNQVFGKGGWTHDDWDLARGRLRRRLSAISYIRSAFSKASYKLPPAREPRPGKQVNPPGGRGLIAKFKGAKGSRATVKKARRGERNASMVVASWNTSGLAVRPQQIVDKALNAGQRSMLADTKKYIERKLQKISRKVSA